MARSFDEAVNVHEHNAPRAKRSEALLRELYHDEVNPRFRVPRMRAVKTALIVSVISIIVFAGSSLFKYNNFIALREAVFATKGNLQGALQRRSNLFSNMVKLTLSHAQLEHAVYSYAARMRTQMSQAQAEVEVAGSSGQDEALVGAGTAAVIMNEKGGTPMSAEQLSADLPQGGAVTALAGAAGMQSSLGRLMAVAERYPEVRSSETYQQMMTALVNMEDLIADRRIEWHHAMRDYNSAIAGWPWALLAQVTGFERMDYFETVEGYDVAPVLSSEIYKELMPVESISVKRGAP